MITVRLKEGKKLSHAGRELGAGSQLALDDKKALWLIEQGVAERVGSPPLLPAEMSPPPVAVEKAAPVPVPRRLLPRCCGWK